MERDIVREKEPLKKLRASGSSEGKGHHFSPGLGLAHAHVSICDQGRIVARHLMPHVAHPWIPGQPRVPIGELKSLDSKMCESPQVSSRGGNCELQAPGLGLHSAKS